MAAFWLIIRVWCGACDRRDDHRYLDGDGLEGLSPSRRRRLGRCKVVVIVVIVDVVVIVVVGGCGGESLLLLRQIHG